MHRRKKKDVCGKSCSDKKDCDKNKIGEICERTSLSVTSGQVFFEK